MHWTQAKHLILKGEERDTMYLKYFCLIGQCGPNFLHVNNGTYTRSQEQIMCVFGICCVRSVQMLSVELLISDSILMISLCWHSQVKTRTANENSAYGSHVMQYGDIGLSTDNLVWYLGTNPENENSTFVDENSLRPPTKAINQRDADLVHFWDKVCSPNCFYLSVTVLKSK